MTSEKCAFNQSWGTCDDKCNCMGVRNSEMLLYPTVNLQQYGDPLIRYPADKQGHVTKIGVFMLLNQII